MNNYKSKSEDLPKHFLLILYIITGSLSNFGAIDILAPQWIYLGAINILSCVYFLFTPNALNTAFRPLFKTVFIYLYLFYIIWNGLSYFYAINPVETLINLPRVGNTFFALFFSYFLIYNLPNKFFFVSRLFLFFLIAELAAYYNDFATVYPKEGLRVIAIKGFAGNKNITAASIAFKLPFVLYIIHSISRQLYRFGLSIVLFGGVLAISLIEARAAILSTLVVFILFLLFQVYLLVIKHYSTKQGVVNIVLTVFPYLVAMLFNIGITNTANKGTITDTVGRIAFTEESSNGRFQYWGDAFNYILKNPILASGLGNWKIASISEGKEHISGYTVPYHAHNDFIHVFTETGILGGLTYISIFAYLTFYLFILLYRKYKKQGILELQYFFLLLPLIVYGLDAGLNFPVARPLMQSSLAIFTGLILGLYLDQKHKDEPAHPIRVTLHKFSLSFILIALVLGISVHIISYISLTKQGQLLYEFNNAKYNLTRSQLDNISHDFPNLTETAMPIKSMKARYYYLQGNKEEAYQMIDQGAKDNPQIFFSENLKSQFLFQEGKLDSAYVYAKRAFDGLPNNMPHYDMYMKTLVAKRDLTSLDQTFEKMISLAGNQKIIWTIYIRSLAQTRSLGDPFAMDKAASAYQLYPNDETIFSLYRLLTYGQQRMVEAENLSNQATVAYNNKEYGKAATLFFQAFDKDPLQHTYSLNAGLGYFESKQYDKAIQFFDLALTSKKESTKEKALRYKGLSMYSLGRGPEACAVFLVLRNKYPKRMYQQELQKYCLTKN
jgi:O-antigen ligase/Tfp pilus assembly protein PilF